MPGVIAAEASVQVVPVPTAVDAPAEGAVVPHGLRAAERRIGVFHLAHGKKPLFPKS